MVRSKGKEVQDARFRIKVKARSGRIKLVAKDFQCFSLPLEGNPYYTGLDHPNSQGRNCQGYHLNLGYCPHLVAVYIRGPIKGYI